MQTTVRHGFLLPEVTDDDPTPNAGVRDTTRFNSNLSDRSTFFDFNETITGRWSFGTITLSNGLSLDLVNNTGAARVSGDVVMLDSNVDRGFIMPVLGAIGPVVGVVVESIAAGAIGRVALEGFVRTKVTGISRLQFLVAQDNSVIAAGTSVGSSAAFGIALENPSGGTALAYLHPSAGSDPESMYKGTTLRSNATSVTAAMLAGKLFFFGYASVAQNIILPDPTLTERPITIAAENAGIQVTATGGSQVIGGSTNFTNGAIQNGIITAPDAFMFKSNGIQWRAA